MLDQNILDAFVARVELKQARLAHDPVTALEDAAIAAIKEIDTQGNYDNYVPIYLWRDRMSHLDRGAQDALLYRLQRCDRLEMSSVVETIHYTIEQLKAGIPQMAGGPLFFLIVNED
jgi:hypothetical protein